jgi:hypothetical protein
MLTRAEGLCPACGIWTGSVRLHIGRRPCLFAQQQRLAGEPRTLAEAQDKMQGRWPHRAGAAERERRDLHRRLAAQTTSPRWRRRHAGLHVAALHSEFYVIAGRP